MLMSRHYNSRQNCNIIANRFFGNMTKLKYLGTGVINQNFIHEEIKSRLKSDIGSYHSVQNFVSFCLLSKNAMISTKL
jgi:hypothetical protein